MSKNREYTEPTQPVQVIELNRSKKWEGKPGFYNGRQVTSRFMLIGELAKMAEQEDGKKVVSIYD